jgi:hypothetical protein
MKASQAPVMPIKQAMVSIAGHVILAVLFADNSIGAAFHMICDLIGVDRRGQTRKVQADPAIYDSLILTTIQTNVIIAEAIPIWLKGIQPGRVSPAARETLIEFQRVAVQTLRAFFFPETREQPQAAPPKEEPKQSVPPPLLPERPPFPGLGDEERYAYQSHMFLAHDGLERHLRDIDTRLLTLTEQMAETRRVVNQHAAILDQHLEALVQHKEVLEQQRRQLDTLEAQTDGYGDQVNSLAAQVRQLEARVRALAARLEE